MCECAIPFSLPLSDKRREKADTERRILLVDIQRLQQKDPRKRDQKISPSLATSKTHARAHAHTHTHKHTHTQTHTHTHTHTNTHRHTHKHARARIDTQTHTAIDIHKQISHTYIHTHAGTHTHVHTHTKKTQKKEIVAKRPIRGP